MRDTVWSALIHGGAALAGFGLGLQVFALGESEPPRVLVFVAFVTES